MTNVEEIKKLKELLDSGIITQDEFDEKKKELLSSEANNSVQVKLKEKKSIPNINLNKSTIIKILAIIGVVLLLIIAIVVGKKVVENHKIAKTEAVWEAGISSIMNDYGLRTYEVKYDKGYEIYAEGFENLKKGDALDLLVELDDCSIDDPYSDEKLKLGTAHVHPGLDVDYYYWRVSSSEAFAHKMINGKLDKPGIYYNKYATESKAGDCVYECKN